MRHKNQLIFLTALIFTGLFARSQDYHFAQYDALPLNLNPSLIGDRTTGENYGVRWAANYREQRSNFTAGTDSYRSYAMGMDGSVGNKFSSGAFFGNSRSVNNVFNVTHFNYGMSYKLIGVNQNSEAKQQLAIGIQVGLVNSSFTPALFTFNQQYSPNASGGFDLSMPSGENFQGSTNLRFSGNTGILYKARMNEDRLTISSGVSIYNITKSTERYNGVLLPVPLRYNAHFTASYRVDERITLAPQALFMYQLAAQELNVGSLFFYDFQNQNRIILGLNWRQNNAVIVQGGVRLAGITFRASYCIGTSYLANYNNRGLEFSLIYINKKKVTEAATE